MAKAKRSNAGKPREKRPGMNEFTVNLKTEKRLVLNILREATGKSLCQLGREAFDSWLPGAIRKLGNAQRSKASRLLNKS